MLAVHTGDDPVIHFADWMEKKDLKTGLVRLAAFNINLVYEWMLSSTFLTYNIHSLKSMCGFMFPTTIFIMSVTF